MAITRMQMAKQITTPPEKKRKVVRGRKKVKKRVGWGMQITKNIIKFNKFLVKIPKETKRVWDLSENRWGYKYDKTMC
mgnify:FL=1